MRAMTVDRHVADPLLARYFVVLVLLAFANRPTGEVLSDSSTGPSRLGAGQSARHLRHVRPPRAC